MTRFAAPELLRLGRPPALAAQDFETLKAASLDDLLARYSAAGIAYDVQMLESDPAVIQTESGSYRTMLARQAIDDAVAQTYLGSASRAHLDHRASDYGVVRRVLVAANPVTGQAEVLEDDASLELRARLSWEALSVAGPVGAYVFHTLDAHPYVLDAIAYGPETGYVEPGEVLVVVQSRDNGGVPTDAMIDAVAARLDAYEVIYGAGQSIVRPVRNRQSVRPLGARVTVAAAQRVTYTTTATLYVTADGDREALRLAALARLEAYQETRRRIGREVPTSGRIAALHLAGADGLPVLDEVNIVEGDVLPDHREIAVCSAITLTVVVR